ncbi:MAG: DHH family phosphoesterase [Chloroflexi bacterium]|nr:DHH family phosphoesterase [Chloroflexota bacterium]
MSDLPLEAARQALQAAASVLVMGHVRPDGDAVGSVLGLGLGLQAQGKQVQMVLVDGVPAALRFLEGHGQIATKADKPFDLAVALDTAELSRLGPALPEGRLVDLNIDHHATNPGFGRINIIDGEAAATAEMLAQHFPALGLDFTPAARAALLAGILTDTQGFRTSNTRPATLRLAADLYEQGAPLTALYHHGLVRRSFESVRLWGLGLANVQRQDGVVWAVISKADRKAANYPGRDDADLVNWLSSVAGARVAVVFIQQDEQAVKVSWRADDGANVARIAGQFGGGGHLAAAGAVVNGSLEDVQARVLAATLAELGASLQEINE